MGPPHPRESSYLSAVHFFSSCPACRVTAAGLLSRPGCAVSCPETPMLLACNLLPPLLLRLLLSSPPLLQLAAAASRAHGQSYRIIAKYQQTNAFLVFVFAFPSRIRAWGGEDHLTQPGYSAASADLVRTQLAARATEYSTSESSVEPCPWLARSQPASQPASTSENSEMPPADARYDASNPA